MARSRGMNVAETAAYQKARVEAESYGFAVSFWIRGNEPKEAYKRARLAARWGARALEMLESREMIAATTPDQS